MTAFLLAAVTIVLAPPCGSAEDIGVGWSVSWNGQPVLTYRYSSDLTKPYIHPLLTPAGHSVTLDSPPDHIHHHGLMFAWGSVRPLSEPAGYHLTFWGEEGDPHVLGRIIPSPTVAPAVTVERDAVRIVTHNEWRRVSDGLLVITERREVISHKPRSESANLVTWISEQRAEMGLVLGPTPGRDVSYYGLGFRTPRDMTWGLVANSNGRTGVEACYGDRAQWCAYATDVVPARGFAMFDHPSNPRHPTGFFVMNDAFGYMTASLVSHEEYPLRRGEVLRLCYGVLAFDGDVDRAFIDREYRLWSRSAIATD